MRIYKLMLQGTKSDCAEPRRPSDKELSMMAVVPIVSGDIDSLVMCKILNNERQEQHPIFIDFGQISGDEEWEACRSVFERCDLPPPERIDLSGLMIGTVRTIQCLRRTPVLFDSDAIEE